MIGKNTKRLYQGNNMKHYLFLSLIITTFCAILVPHISLAQVSEQNYYEASPAISSSAITISSFGAIYQTFRPNNDFINGFDVWLQNTGGSGTLSFALLDDTNTTIVTKSMTVGSLAPQWAGTRVHLNLGDNVPVTSGALYKLKLWTSMPQLKMYYVNGVNILEHNASITLNTENVVRSAYVDSSEQSFVFKIAFYEKNTDTTPPIISNLSFVAPHDTEMKVSVNANEPIDYKIDYRATLPQNGIVDVRTGNFTNTFNFCVDDVTPCALTIPVYANMTYQYELYTRDYWNNETVMSGTFDSSKNEVFELYPTSTPATPTSTQYIISNARVSLLTPTAAQFAWDTDLPSASRILISTNPEWSEVVTRLGDNTFELTHSMSTGNVLTPQTTYYALIAADSYSSLLEGTALTFTTPSVSSETPQSTSTPPATTPPPPTPTPDIPTPVTIKTIIDNAFSDSASTPLSNPNQYLPNLTIATEENGDTTVRWADPSPHTNYRIDVFDAHQQLIKQINVKGSAYEARIDTLPPGEYRAIVYGERNGTYEKIVQSTNFRAKAKGESFWENIGSESVLISVAGFGFILIMIAAVLAIIKKNEIANL